MDKKKAVKIVAATAIAASALTAVAPVQSEAAASLTSQIKSAQAKMKKPYDRYIKATTLASITTVEKDIKAAKQAQKDINAKIKKAKLKTKDKNKKLADVKAYDKYITRAEGYVKAYKAASTARTNLNKLAAALENASEADVQAKNAALQTAIKKAEKTIKDTVYGAKVETLLINKFTKPVKTNTAKVVASKAEAAKVNAYVNATKDLTTLEKVNAATELRKAINLDQLTVADQSALHDKLAAADKAVADAEAALQVVAVEEVKAINATTVEVKGTNLSKLAAENFSVEGNKVTSYNVNAETGVATLTFENKFESAKEVTIKVTQKVEGEADKVSEFKFTYTLEVKSVAANALTVDDNTAGQKLTFKMNDEATDADVDYLKASGYTVEFQATTGVFVGGASSSATGELNTTLTPDSKFSYKVVVFDKDGKKVAESSLVDVQVINKANVVTSISSYELVKDGSVKLANNTVLLNETVAIDNVIGNKADGTKDANLDSIVEYSSSNKAVALVDSTGNILPITAGTTTITIKAGDVTKSFTLTVAADARVAKSATLSTSSIKLVEGKEAGSVGVVVKDQYGEVVSGLDFATGVSYETTKVDVDGKATDIVDVTGTKTDAEGKASLTVTPAKAGSGTVKVKVGENTIATLNVSVSKDTTAATRKLELVDASKDANLDIYTGEAQDNTVQFVYNQYNADGFLLGKETAISGDKYSVAVEEATGKDIIDAAVDAGVITVTAKKDAGTAYLVVKEGSVERERVAITVVNSTPTISAVTTKVADKVTTATTVDAASVLTLKAETGKDAVVENITLTTTTSKAVRLDAATGEIYVDADGNGALDQGELVVGTVSVTENLKNDTTTTSIATQTGDKGSVVYTIKDANGKVTTTAVVDVEVK